MPNKEIILGSIMLLPLALTLGYYVVEIAIDAVRGEKYARQFIVFMAFFLISMWGINLVTHGITGR